MAIFASAWSPPVRQWRKISAYKTTKIQSAIRSADGPRPNRAGEQLSPVLDELANEESNLEPHRCGQDAHHPLWNGSGTTSPNKWTESATYASAVDDRRGAAGAPERELIVLPDWLKQIVRKKAYRPVKA